MRVPLTVAALAVAGTAAMAQAPAPAQSTPPQTPPSTLTTLTGCVSDTGGPKRIYTLADSLAGDTYELKGMNVRGFVGKRVEITGQRPKGLKVVGGLYPNANVAAQAGAIDPTKAAMAAQAGPTANQPKPPIEFTVKSVKVVAGECK